MPAPFALYTLDYPPERGGVARYLGDLVTVANGELDVFVPETHALTGPGTVRTLRSFARAPFAWRPMIPSLLSLKRQGYRGLLLSHIVPVGTAALIAHGLGGVPFAVLVHGLDLRLAATSARKTFLAKQVLKRAAAVFTNSEAVSREVRQMLPTIQPIVVTPGLRPKTFVSRADARRRLGIGDGAFVCLTVARLVARKGIDAMLRLLPRLPENVRYVVIGDGADKGRLEGIMREEGATNAQILSACSDEARDLWLAAADLFVFLAREEGIDLEGFGIAPLEASQAGLPVLAGNTGGVGEAVVDGETGLLVDALDPAAVKQAFLRLYQDPELRQRLGASGKVRADRSFGWETRWERMRAALERMDADASPE